MSQHRIPIQAKAVEPSISTARGLVPRPGKKSLRPDAEADEILERIRELVTDHFRAACRLADEAAARFPDHAGLQNARRVLSPGKSIVRTGGPEPSSREELDWLRHPPESVRGKWVALVGGELVATADTLAEINQMLSTRALPKPALVHRID